MIQPPRIDPDRLVDFAAAVYEGAGMPAADARLIADTLVQADLWGHQSHGVLRLGWYLERVQNGVMQPVTAAQTVGRSSPATRCGMPSGGRKRTGSGPSPCATPTTSAPACTTR